jgi:predicted dithiol-disulfide oxidoreductase (DUF899 family)
MTTAFPNESVAYRAARDQLLEQELAHRRVTEALAAARRALPPGGEVPEDYLFEQAGADGAPAIVRMSELFAPGKETLAIYNFMFGPEMDGPCPSCSSFLDAFDGAVEHAGQRINVAIVAKSPVPRILAVARERGWRRLRLLSSFGNTYNRDYFGEEDDGSQIPMLNVFRRDEGVIRHFWGSELMFAPTEDGQDPRHSDTIDPLWNLFDFTPEGRGTDWYPKLSYA